MDKRHLVLFFIARYQRLQPWDMRARFASGFGYCIQGSDGYQTYLLSSVLPLQHEQRFSVPVYQKTVVVAESVHVFFGQLMQIFHGCAPQALIPAGQIQLQFRIGMEEEEAQVFVGIDAVRGKVSFPYWIIFTIY